MRIFLLFCLIFLSAGLLLNGQRPGKPLPPDQITPSHFQIEDFSPAVDLSAIIPRAARYLPIGVAYQGLGVLSPPMSRPGLRVTARGEDGRPLYVSGEIPAATDALSLPEQAFQYLEAAAPLLGIRDPREAFVITHTYSDELGFSHLRLQQQFKGLSVHGSELRLHARGGRISLLNGRTFPSPDIGSTLPGLNDRQARQTALSDLGRRTTVRELTTTERRLAHDPEAAPELVVYHHRLDNASERLAWHVRLTPNLAEHWEYFVDAQSGEILNHFRVSCSLLPVGLPPGPTTAQAVDLKGLTRTINVYEQGGAYFLLDASRPMFNPALSNLPNDPAGVIWTIDAQNTNPFSGELEAVQIVSGNNNWNNPVAVSAHYNASIAYEYFRNRFDRNSINGAGGNVVSLINVTEESGEQMDNAFWNGFAMFYGNGNTFFSSPLARSLDVAGHEMSHGVIQNTANLTYQGQSGALNESFADVFGVLIDPADYQLGDDVVNPFYYPTGALRDMADPNNGGNSLNDPGWQPAHMDEFQELPLSQDNGGVHINSGIPNRAFYLFASEVGNSKAEQVYYRALESYLTASSQFIDCRLAVIQAATDLYGGGSPEASAAADAFAAVGIGPGSGSSGQEDLQTNPGQDYILATDGSLSGLYLYDWQTVNQISNSGVLSRPSVTDDGTVIVFVAADQTLRALILNEQTGQYEEFHIENNPQQIWRNIAISKDGSRIAMLTDDYDNTVQVFDYTSSTGAAFDLRNPTTAPGGGSTDDVAYADVLEWDYSGEFLMYDALNQLDPTAGGTEYWDIGLIQVWDNAGQSFADGFTVKLFSSLPAGSSVGNPTFAKNSPFIISFDFIGNTDLLNDVTILGANVETGEIGEVYYNGDLLGVPNYSVEDDALIFNSFNPADGGATVDLISLADDKITGIGATATILNGGQYGTWFARGERELVRTNDPAEEGSALRAQPNPFNENLQLVFDSRETGAGQLQLFDPLGRLVWKEGLAVKEGENRIEVGLRSLPSGVYTARLWTGEGKASVRVVKK